MSLKVWLPLNGNLENKGASDVTISGSSTFGSGKTGQCINSSEQVTISISNYTQTKVWSFCFWGYIKSSLVKSDWTKIIQFSDGGSNMRVECCQKASYSGMYTYTLHNNTTNKIFSGLISSNASLYDQWAHICFTSDGTTIKKFVNGVYTGLSTPYNGTGYLTGTIYLQNNDIVNKSDFRFYDHCLSQEEVREIAKGLVLHYPLNSVYNTGINNMLPIANQLGAPAGYSSGQITVTPKDGYYNYKLNYKGTGSNSWPAVNLGQVTSALGWVAGTTYCYHFKFRVNSYTNGPSFTFRAGRLGNDYMGCRSENICQAKYLDGQWHVLDLIQAVPASFTYSGSTIACTGPLPQLYCGNLNVSGTTYTFDIDIAEVGVFASSVAVPFVYSGFKDSTVYDCSGFGNNGTIDDISKITLSTQSPRYDSCLTMNSYIYTYNSWFMNGPYTMSVWVNPTVASSAGNTALIDLGRDGLVIETGRWFIYNASHAATVNSISIPLNEWSHIVVVCNGTKTSLYKNGVFLNEINGIGAPYGSKATFINTRGQAGSDANGSYSDFRIYATALSADDIKLLYSRGASIDNTGKLHCGEITEGKSKIQVEKSTEVNCTDIDEVSRTKAQFYKSGKIGTTYLIES